MTFESDTDTEVIPKLCMYVFQNLTEPLAFSEVRRLPLRACSCTALPFFIGIFAIIFAIIGSFAILHQQQHMIAK